MVEASARICSFLATLNGEEEERGTARLAERAAASLARRADSLAVVKSSSFSRAELDPSSEIDFPPDMVEW
jgi:hypothetical protein